MASWSNRARKIQDLGKRKGTSCQEKLGKICKEQRRATRRQRDQAPDAFHPRVLLGLSDETCHKVADFLHVVEVIGKWPTAASCISFFFVANWRRKIRWWEWATECIMGDWKRRSTVEWDAPAKKTGGAEHTMW